MFVWSDYASETYSNEEVIALNQEIGAKAALRLAGGDLVFGGCQGHNCTNVWGRQLASGVVAIAMVNNDDNDVIVTCDHVCFERLLGTKVPVHAGFIVRDLWTKRTTKFIKPPFHLSSSVVGKGGSRLFSLTPTPPLPTHTV